MQIDVHDKYAISRGTSNKHEIMATLYQQVVRVFADGCEENGTYGPVGILWDFM